MLLLLGLLPERFEFIGGGQLRGATALAQLFFYPLKAALEFAIGLFQRRFRIKRKITSDIDQHEKQITDLFFETVTQLFGYLRFAGSCDILARRMHRRRKLLQFVLQLFCLFGEFGKKAADLRPVESNVSCARAELMSFEERGHGG